MHRSRLPAVIPLLVATGWPSAVGRADDPLPPGAVARLGTLDLGPLGAKDFHFAAGGKTFHAAVAGPAVVHWDAATGRRLRVVPLPGLAASWPWVSPDGGTAVVEQDGGARHVVDVATGRTRFVLPSWVTLWDRGEPFSPDGRFLAAFGPSRRVHVWDTTTGEERVIGPPEQAAQFLRFAPGGGRLVTMGIGGLACWEVPSGKLLWAAEPAGKLYPEFARFSPDGRFLAVHSREPRQGGWYAILDLATGKPAEGLTPPASSPFDIPSFRAFTRDGRAALVQTQKGTPPVVSEWDLGEGKVRREWPGRRVNLLDPDGRTALGTDGGRLQRWDLATGKQLFPDPGERGHTDRVTGVAFDPTGRRVFTTAADGTLRVWDPADGRLVKTHPFPHPEPADVPMDGPAILARRDGGLLLHRNLPGKDVPELVFDATDPDTGRVGQTIRIPTPGRADELYRTAGRFHLTADGRTLWLVTGKEGRGFSGPPDNRTELRAWDAVTGAPGASREFKPPGYAAGGTLTDDGRVLCDGQHLYDAGTGNALVKLTAPGAAPYMEPVFSRGGRFVAVRVMQDRGRGDLLGVQVWDVPSGRPVARVVVGADRMALTPDGRFLVTLDATGVSAWDVVGGRQVVHHKADPRALQHEGRPYTTALAVAPDGRTAATGRADGTGLVWDLTGAHRAAAPGPPPTDAELAAGWAAFAPDQPQDPLAAMWRMVDHPGRSLPFLRAKVPPPAPGPTDDEVRRLIADLDSPEFRTREEAEGQLGRLGPPARRLVEAALPRASSAEQRVRLGRVAAKLAPRLSPLPPADVPLAWAVAVLERVGSAEARAVLRDLAGGPADRRVTQEAAAALARLGAEE